MSAARKISALLFGAGVLLCTISDPAPSEVPRVDGYFVLGADFHVHTAFGDGGLPPWDAAREAQRRGIDVIAVTNHNQMLAGRLHRWLFGSGDVPLVLVGQEVTSPDHHILAIGVTKPVREGRSAADIIASIHAQQGVAIAAHPHGEAGGGYDARALAQIDGVERAHPGMRLRDNTPAQYAAFFARARQHNPPVAPIGDSDFHFASRIGLCRTYVLAREISEGGVLDAVRDGRTVAYDALGVAYGEPAFVEIAARARRARDAAGPRRSTRHTSILGAFLVWTGMLGLVLAGPGPDRSSL